MAEQPYTYWCKLKNRRVSVTKVDANTYEMEFVRLQDDLGLMGYDGEPNRHVSIRRGVVTTRFALSRDAFLALLTAGVGILKREEQEANHA